MDKKSRLTEIAREIAKCTRCKKGSLGKPVPGEGSAEAKIIFIGEAPGKEEAKTGRPFIGRSGKLLRSLINAVGLREQDVYITSPVKYLPKRGTPTHENIIHGFTHLSKQLEIIKPQIVVLLGKSAYFAFFNKPILILKEHGKIIEISGQKYLATLHPAAVVRFPKYKRLLTADFRKLKTLIT